MDNLVIFASGYRTEISETEDFGIKEFPEKYSRKLCFSLEKYLFQQKYLSNPEIQNILIWGYEKGKYSRPAVLLPGVISRQKDHVERQAFCLHGKLLCCDENVVNVQWHSVANLLEPRKKSKIAHWVETSKESYENVWAEINTWSQFYQYHQALHSSNQHYRNKNRLLLILMLILLLVSIFAIKWIVVIAHPRLTMQHKKLQNMERKQQKYQQNWQHSQQQVEKILLQQRQTVSHLLQQIPWKKSDLRVVGFAKAQAVDLLKKMATLDPNKESAKWQQHWQELASLVKKESLEIDKLLEQVQTQQATDLQRAKLSTYVETIIKVYSQLQTTSTKQ